MPRANVHRPLRYYSLIVRGTGVSNWEVCVRGSVGDLFGAWEFWLYREFRRIHWRIV